MHCSQAIICFAIQSFVKTAQSNDSAEPLQNTVSAKGSPNPSRQCEPRIICNDDSEEPIYADSSDVNAVKEKNEKIYIEKHLLYQLFVTSMTYFAGTTDFLKLLVDIKKITHEIETNEQYIEDISICIKRFLQDDFKIDDNELSQETANIDTANVERFKNFFIQNRFDECLNTFYIEKNASIAFCIDNIIMIMWKLLKPKIDILSKSELQQSVRFFDYIDKICHSEANQEAINENLLKCCVEQNLVTEHTTKNLNVGLTVLLSFLNNAHEGFDIVEFKRDGSDFFSEDFFKIFDKYEVTPGEKTLSLLVVVIHIILPKLPLEDKVEYDMTDIQKNLDAARTLELLEKYNTKIQDGFLDVELDTLNSIFASKTSNQYQCVLKLPSFDKKLYCYDFACINENLPSSDENSIISAYHNIYDSLSQKFVTFF